MNFAALAIAKRPVTYFATALVILGGIASFFALGQLEDPDFSIKTAVVTTPYPGASPKEVELEVTDRIEIALQQLPQVDYLESFSSEGLSLIKVNIKTTFWSDKLPQIWDEVRRKVNDVAPHLPPGAGPPAVNDDFGAVFGHQLAVTGDGFDYAELETYAKELKKELSLVDGVARVDLWGVQPKIIYLDVSRTQLSQLGLTAASIEQTLNRQNVVVDSGHVDVGNRRLRFETTGSFETAEDIENLLIRPSAIDALLSRAENSGGQAQTSELIRIGDFGTVRRGYQEPPSRMMRFNGVPAIGISITNNQGVNIVDVGKRIDTRLAEMLQEIPVGIEVTRIHWQSDIVDQAVSDFLISFLQALVIVLVVLALFTGWRLGLIIGTALVVTILGSFMVMAAMGIDLQRMSLGALIIALGMMVDNAIVVADGFATRIARGMDREKAAIEAAQQPAWPLLGATIVAVVAFFPIYVSPEGTGEFLQSLFLVVAISLLISWLVSVTLTPLQCLDSLPTPKDAGEDKEPGRFATLFRNFLTTTIRFRWFTMASMVGMLVASIIGFGNVTQLFFPDSSMTKFMVDFWFPQGTRIEQVASSLKPVEERLIKDERVDNVSAYIGAGPPRFYLPVDPESPNPAYAQLIVNVKDRNDIDAIAAELEPWFAEVLPDALIPIRRFGVGPSNTFKFEVRISGPASAEPETLRKLADDVIAVVEASPLTGYTRTDWRQRVQKVVTDYSQDRARWAGVMREDIAKATKQGFDGRTIGLFREDDDLIPIVLRNVAVERSNVGALDVLPVQPENSIASVPLSQVADGVLPEWEDPFIVRRDRRRTIQVQANPVSGTTFPSMLASVKEQVEAVPAPPGYTIEWGGEFEDSSKSQKALIPGIIPAVVLMVLIIVVLFNAFRPPLIIFTTIPFAVIGITVGLLVTNTPFGFVALLGGMSLAGMMIKNAIVLLDEVNIELAGGQAPFDAVINAALSRLRPVMLAAATTVLGVIPLLQDVFWVGLAVTIMGGLSFGTILTMIVVPVLYSIFYKVEVPPSAAAKEGRPSEAPA